MTLTQWLVPLGVFVAVTGLGGILVLVSGVVPIKASAEHWPITAWFLEFGKRRSVSTHTLGAKTPQIDDPALVLRGAGHFDIGCRPCHGSPDLTRPRIAHAMTPKPPYLPPQIAKWAPDELFYIVKHGIKFTGMPAWPAQHRDDEVWSMVAFLRRLPSLDSGAYRRLVFGDVGEPSKGAPMADLDAAPEPPPPQPIVDVCARCHGVDGNGRGEGAFPRLNGQRPQYLEQALRAYATSHRPSGIMGPIAAALDDKTLANVVSYYARQPPMGRLEAAASATRGAQIAHRGIPQQLVPACLDCHGPAPDRNPAYPRLDGQYGEYLRLQLDLFAQGVRGGSPYAHIMQPIASRLTPDQMRDVAAYFASAGDTLKTAARY